MTNSELVLPTATVAGSKRQALGVGLIVVSTVAIALVPSLAKLAYEGGSNTLSVITGRSIFSVLVTFLLLVVLRQPIAIARRPLLIGLGVGVGYAVILYGYLGAVNYLPVNQVILIYFIHPLLVGLIATYLSRERLTLVSVSALGAAVVGLSLAIGFSFDRLDPLGIGLAAMAMVATARDRCKCSGNGGSPSDVYWFLHDVLGGRGFVGALCPVWKLGLADYNARLGRVHGGGHCCNYGNARLPLRHGLCGGDARRHDYQSGTGTRRVVCCCRAGRTDYVSARRWHRNCDRCNLCDGITRWPESQHQRRSSKRKKIDEGKWLAGRGAVRDRRHARHQQLVDPAAVEVDDFEPPAGVGEIFADLRDAAEMLEDEPRRPYGSHDRPGTSGRGVRSRPHRWARCRQSGTSRHRRPTIAGSGGPSFGVNAPTMASRMSAGVTSPRKWPYSSGRGPCGPERS